MDVPALVVANAVQLVARGTIDGKPWVNVHGVRFGVDGTGGGIFVDQTMAGQLGASLRSLYSSLSSALSTKWILNEILLLDLQFSTAPSYDTGIATLTGAATGDMVPSHLAICATHRTAYRGRSYRGRTYLAGYTESQNDANGRVLATTRTAIEGAFSSYRTSLASIATIQAKQAVISRTLSNAFEVVTTQVNEDWDHQDRRKD